MSKLLKKLAAEKAAAKEIKKPETVAAKEGGSVGKTFNPKAATKAECDVMNVAWAVKTLRGGNLTDGDKYALSALARDKAPTLTSDITEVIPSGPQGSIIDDVWEATTASNIFGLEQIDDPSTTRALRDGRMQTYITGEGNDMTESSYSYASMAYKVSNFTIYNEHSYQMAADSMVNQAQEVIYNMTRQMAQDWDIALINADNTGTYDGSSWDATDIYGNSIGSGSVYTAFKGVRKLAIEKEKVDFLGDSTYSSGMTDDQFLEYVLKMQEAGGKYLSPIEAQQGNVVLFVPTPVYNRMRRMADFTAANRSGVGSTLSSGAIVDTFFNIPVVVNDFIPKTSPSGIITNASPDTDVYHSIFMVNIDMMMAYAKRGSQLAETDRNIKNQTLAYSMSARLGFNGLYDAATTSLPVDATRPYAVSGININITKA